MSKRGQVLNAVCLECWREGKYVALVHPMGYYDAPCLRHGKNRPSDPIRLITEADISFDPVQTDQADFPAWPDKKK